MPAPELADTGSLRGDLMTAACGQSGWAEEISMSALAGLLTAVNADPQLFRLWQERFLLPRMEWNRAVFERAIARGEIADDVNLDLLSTLIPSMCMFRAMVLGQPVDAAFVTAVIDGLLIPAVGPDPSSDRPCS
jgi:hypothetical protein